MSEILNHWDYLLHLFIKNSHHLISWFHFLNRIASSELRRADLERFYDSNELLTLDYHKNYHQIEYLNARRLCLILVFILIFFLIFSLLSFLAFSQIQMTILIDHIRFFDVVQLFLIRRYIYDALTILDDMRIDRQFIIDFTLHRWHCMIEDDWRISMIIRNIQQLNTLKCEMWKEMWNVTTILQTLNEIFDFIHHIIYYFLRSSIIYA